MLLVTNKESGGKVHRYLIKKSYKILLTRGYHPQIEYRISNKRKLKADVFGSKDNKKIIVECLSNPTKSFIKNKVKRYREYCDLLILAYPSNFNFTFNIFEYFDEAFPIVIPDKIMKKSIQIQVSDEVWDMLRLRKIRPSHTFDEIIRELIKNERIKKTK